MQRSYLENRLLRLPSGLAANGQNPGLAVGWEQVHNVASARAQRDAFMEREQAIATRVLALTQAVGIEERLADTGTRQKSAIIYLFPARDNRDKFTAIGARLHQIFAAPNLQTVQNSLSFVAYGAPESPERVLEWKRSFDHQAYGSRLRNATPGQLNTLAVEGIFACQAEFETELTALEAVAFGADK